jgi:hypothetical protein
MFFCSSHRKEEFDTSRRVSIAHFVAHMGSDLRCVLCGQGNETEDSDIMRAYIVPGSVAGSNGSSMVALHSFCAKYTNVVALEDDVSEIVCRRVSGSTNLNAYEVIKCSGLRLRQCWGHDGSYQDLWSLWLWGRDNSMLSRWLLRKLPLHVCKGAEVSADRRQGQLLLQGA